MPAQLVIYGLRVFMVPAIFVDVVSELFDAFRAGRRPVLNVPLEGFIKPWPAGRVDVACTLNQPPTPSACRSPRAGLPGYWHEVARPRSSKPQLASPRCPPGAPRRRRSRAARNRLRRVDADARRAVQVEPLRRVQRLLWAGALLQRRQRRRRRGREVGRGPLVGLAHVEQERVAFCDVGLDGLEVRRQRRAFLGRDGTFVLLGKRIVARNTGCEE